MYVQLSAWDAAFGKLGWYSLTHGSLAEPLLAGMRNFVLRREREAPPTPTLARLRSRPDPSLENVRQQLAETLHAGVDPTAIRTAIVRRPTRGRGLDR